MKTISKYRLKMTGLWAALFLTLTLMVVLTIKGVDISVVPPEKYMLENVQYVGIGESSCYHMVCEATMKFQDGYNIYQLTGSKHDMETLVVNSYYNIYYDNNSKKIKNYDFAQTKK